MWAQQLWNWTLLSATALYGFGYTDSKGKEEPTESGVCEGWVPKADWKQREGWLELLWQTSVAIGSNLIAYKDGWGGNEEQKEMMPLYI